MPEQLNLPVATGPTTTLWRVKAILMDRGLSSSGESVVLTPDTTFLQITLIGQNGQTVSRTWRGTDAETKIGVLNKANLTTNSLEKRALNLFVTDGIYAGTVTGSPD